jgi:predicted  nucleic acid-binding Zn-ribbon protein
MEHIPFDEELFPPLPSLEAEILQLEKELATLRKRFLHLRDQSNQGASSLNEVNHLKESISHHQEALMELLHKKRNAEKPTLGIARISHTSEENLNSRHRL